MKIPAPSFQFSFRSLTPQLFGFFVLPLTILLLLIAFGGINLHQQAMRTLVGERDERAARAVAQTLEEQLNHRATAVRTLSLRIQDQSESDELMSILESSELPPSDFEYGLAFMERGGEVLVWLGDSSLWENFDPKADSVLQEQLIRDVPPKFIQITHPEKDEPVLLVTAPSNKGGPVAVGAFSPSELAHRAIAGVFTPGEKSVAFLIDENRNLLYQVGSFADGETHTTHPGVSEGLAGQSGATYVDMGDSEHVIAYSPVPPIGWGLIIEEPWELVTTPLLRTTENAPLILMPALILSILALWFGLRQVVQPLKALEKQAAEVGWGNFEAIEVPVGGVAEIQRLQSELIHLARKVQASQQGLRGYIGAMTTGQEEERRRLARELHDDTLQALIALKQRVQLVRLSLNGNEAGGQLAEIQDLTDQTISNLRRITRALRPIYLEELGLVAALEALAQESRQSNIEVAFTAQGEQKRLNSTEEMALYRIAQEAINNILRHSGARWASLKLYYESGAVRLQIQDNGVGFEVPESLSELTPKGHFGLLSLHERAELIGAKLKIESQPNNGTKIEVILPDK